MTSVAGGSRVIEDCRGDLDRLAAMLETAWAASETTPFLYTPAFLETSFAYPGFDTSLAPTIYDGDEPIAFVAGFPRTIRVGGEEHRILVIALLTAAAEHRDRGYGIVVWTELVRRAREAGFDGMVNYCVEGEAMNRMIAGACRRLRLPVEQVFSNRYLSKLLRPAGSDGQDDERGDGVEAFLAAAAPVAEQAALARVWTPAEAGWQCGRGGAVVARLAARPVDGVLAGSVQQLANPRRTRCLVIDDVLWGSLAGEERVALVRRLLEQAAAQGAQIAVLPDQGYADLAPFAEAGFRPSGRIVHAYLTLWNGSPLPAAVSSCYLDVF
jgi:hypothetical protein